MKYGEPLVFRYRAAAACSIYLATTVLIETIDSENTEFDESDEEEVDAVEYISHNSDSEQSLDDDYDDNGNYLFSNWSII